MDARVYLRKNGYWDVADLIDKIMAEWATAENKTRPIEESQSECQLTGEVGSMDNFQRVFIGAGLIVVAAMALWPPWIETWKTSNSSTQTPIGYYSVFSPPTSSGPRATNDIDTARLFLQTIAVIAVMSAVVIFQPLLYRKNDASRIRQNVDYSAEEPAPRISESPYGERFRHFIHNGGLFWSILLAIGCTCHILFSAEGIFRQDGMILPWKSQYPVALLASMAGYATPGIVLSIIVFLPVFHYLSPSPRTRLTGIRHVNYAVFVGLAIRLSWYLVEPSASS